MEQEGILAISVTQQAEYVVVEVRNSGCDIPPEVQDPIEEFRPIQMGGW